MDNRSLSAGSGALFLTVLGTISQILGFFYRVVLSRLVGAEVMGLYQLIMPVYSVLMSLTAVGLTSAVSNLTAQYLARDNRLAMEQTLSRCLRWFFAALVPLGVGVILCSDALSVLLLGDARTQLGLILLIPCVALTGVENFHKHTFYGSGLVQPPAVVEILEQLVRAGAVLGLLLCFLPQYPERVVGLIVAGMVICEVFSSCTLVVLYRRRLAHTPRSGPGVPPISGRKKIVSIALPVGLNALLGNLLSAANATLIPQKLVAGGMTQSEAVSRFGVLSGMTLPLLALPTVYLGPLSLVLGPRLARAFSLNQAGQIRRLTGRAMEATALLTLPAMALMTVFGPDLGKILFHQEGVAEYLFPLACVMGMSCYCSVLSCALNAVEQQKAVAAISLLGSGIQLLFTAILVPDPAWGIGGYVAGALVSTLGETLLFLYHLYRYTGLRPDLYRWIVAPGLSALLSALTANLLLRFLRDGGLPLLAAAPGVLVFAIVLYLSALHAQGISLRGFLSVFRKRA